MHVVVLAERAGATEIAAGASGERTAYQRKWKQQQRPTPPADAISAQTVWHSALLVF
jgi:hypothetical protein